MICKDCAHYDVCNYWVKKQYGENRYLEAREGFICEDFKDKSKFIELPSGERFDFSNASGYGICDNNLTVYVIVNGYNHFFNLDLCLSEEHLI